MWRNFDLFFFLLWGEGLTSPHVLTQPTTEKTTITMAVRRSARLKLKEEEEQERYRTPLRGGQAVKRRLSSTSNSFSEEGSPPATSAIKEQLECEDIVSASDEDVVAVTPKRKQTRKTNNFLKL